MKTTSLRFRKVSLLSCILLISQQVLFVPVLAAQDGLAAVNSDGIPNGASVVAGSANIQVNGNNLNINSLSDRTIINWNNFSVGSGNAVNFNQPGLSSAVLNRVISTNPSAINGIINSNGNVMLVNPNGIVIGSGGVINTNGFTASVFDISNEDFLNGGDLTFSGNSSASVINAGSIFTGSGGIHLLGNTVINTGLIESSGNINLLSGGTVQLKNGVTYTQADAATIQNGISETAGLIRNSGTIRATGSMEVGGEVYLVAPGGKVFNEGMIAASKSNVGGNVVVTGNEVELKNATIDVSGDNGGGQVNIGGGFQGKDPSILNAATTTVDENTLIIADALVNGDGGQVVVWSDEATDFAGTISSRGGSSGGNGGLVEVSGMSLAFDGKVSTTAANGATGWLLLDPVGIRIIPGEPANPTPGVDPVLTITDGQLNSVLAENNILLATSPTRTDILVPGDLPSGRGPSGANDDNIVVARDTNVDTGSNTLFFSTSTVDLYSSITGNVAGGLSSGASLPAPLGPVKDPSVVNVFGSGSCASGDVQNAVDIVGVGGTVNLGGGEFDSFEVNKMGVTINGLGAFTRINAASPAVTVSADNVTVQNVNLVGTGSAGDIGVLLDGIAAPNLTGTTISNVNIFNMDDGITSQGDIGDGNASNIDLTISGLSQFTPALFQDFLDSAIDLNDTDGDVVVRINDIVVADSILDLNGLATGGDGINLGDIGGADLDRVGVFGTGGDGIHIDEVNDAVVELSQIQTALIDGNAIEFDETVFDSTILVETSALTSSGNAIQFDDLVDNSDITITRNNSILSIASDGIGFNSPVDNSTVNIESNFSILGADDGINIDELFNTNFNVIGNSNIRGTNGSGIEFDDTVGPFSNVQINDNPSITGGEEAIEFDTNIIGSTVGISGNFTILGGLDGIQFKDTVAGSLININDNPLISGLGGSGIVFEEAIGGSLIFVGNNLAVTGGTDNGIGFEDTIDLSGVLLFNNNVNSSGHGVFFGDEINLSGIGVVANRIGADSDGIKFEGDVVQSLVGVLGNQTFTNGNGIAFSDDGPGNQRIDDSLVFIAGNRIDGQVVGGGTPDTGIEFEVIEGNSTVVVRDNEVIETDSDGIRVLRRISDNALLRIRGNTLGAAGTPLGNGGTDHNGIDIDRVNSTRGVEIFENEVFASGNAIEFDDNIRDANILIFDNPNLVGINGAAIQFDRNIRGTANVLIENNVLTGVGGINMRNNGSIVDDVSFVVTNNVIDATTGRSGIRLANIGTSQTVLLDSNQITGGNFGINLVQTGNAGNNGLVEISNTLISDALNTGIRIRNGNASNTLETTIQENVTIVGGQKGMLFIGPGLSLTGDTLGNTSFVGTLGNFIELQNGALFDPGQPTLIDATNVNFDGINSNTIAGFAEIESRVVHFIDDPTLGLFWPGFEPLTGFTYDEFERHADLFETIEALIGSGNPGTMNYGEGGNAPNSDEFQDGRIQQQDANSYDVFGG